MGFLIDNIDYRIEEDSAWVKLNKFQSLSDVEFECVYNESLAAINENKINNVTDAGMLIAMLVILDAIKVKPLSEQNVNDIKSFIKRLVERQSNFEQLYNTQASFIKEYNFGTQLYDNRYKQNDSIKIYFLELCDKQSLVLPDDIQYVLRNLSDSNVGNLIEIDERVYPDKSERYCEKPIFYREDPKKIFDSLKSMSNGSVSSFTSYLRNHYKLKSLPNQYNYKMKDDAQKLRSLNGLVENYLENLSGLQKFIFSDLAYTIKRAAESCDMQK